MQKPVKPMAHNKKSKTKPVSVKPKPKHKPAVAAKCKPCKPCEQHIYYHFHNHGHGEDIGNFGISDLKAIGSSIKDKIIGHSEPEPVPTQRFYKQERNLNTPIERARRERSLSSQPTISPRPTPSPQPSQQPPQPPQPTILRRVERTITSGVKTLAAPYAAAAVKDLERQKAARQNQQPSVSSQWTTAIIGVGDNIKARAAQAVTPQGAYNIAKAGARGAYKAGKFAVDESYKGMSWLEQKRQDELAYQQDQREQKVLAWYRIPAEKRQEILEEQAMRKQMAHKLKRMRRQAEEYELDRADAYLSGRRFTPKVFKMASEDRWGDPVYMDEYGRELPGLPEEVNKKPVRQQRSESKEINDIFGFSSGGGGRSYPSPLAEPQRQLMGADEGMYDQPRRRVRYAAEPPQYSSQRRIEGGVSPRKEADDIRRLLM